MAKKDANEFLHTITTTLDGSSGRPEEMVFAGDNHPCPICGSSDGVSVNMGTKVPVVVHCHSTKMEKHDRQIIAWLKERKAWPSSKDFKAIDPEAWKAAMERQQKNRLRQAKSIYKAAKASGKKPTRYLRSRGIKVVPKNAYYLEKGVLVTRVDKFTGERKEMPINYPAAVFPVWHNERGLTGVHLVALNDRGSRKRFIKKKSKLSFGLTKAGYVQLGKFDPKQPLIIAEGIETALSAAQVCGDLPAIATLGSEGMEALCNLPKPYRAGSEVIVARDRGVGGKRAANVLSRRLARLGYKVRRPAPPVEKDDDGSYWDWNDWLTCVNGNASDLKELRHLLRKAPIVHPPKGDGLSMIEWENLDIPQLSHLVAPVLVDPGMTMLHARAGHGKTRFALSIAYAYATGEPLMDWTVPKPGVALYVDAELSPENMKGWILRLGTPTPNLVALSDKWNYRVGKPKISLVVEEDREYLAQQIAFYDPKLVILDSLLTLAPPEMTEGKMVEDRWPAINEWLRNLKRQGRHVILLHHDGKGGSQYGSSLKEIEFDLMMQLKQRANYNAPGVWAFELSFSKPRHLSSQEAEPRIITATDKGQIEWERTDATVDERAAKAKEKREQVAKLIGEGLTTSEIAKKLRITARRVRQIKQELNEEQDDE